MRKTAGITLVEVLLVLAVATSILFMSINVYKSLSEQTDEQRLLANVDQIFQAMATFYQMSCQGQTATDSSGNLITPGVLNPANTSTPPSLSNPTVITLTTLISDGLLNSSAIKINPLVLSGGANLVGYYAQFNPMTSHNITYTACTSSTNCTATTVTNAGSSSQTVMFRIQVGVATPTGMSTTSINLLKATLGATCLTTVTSGVLTPCSTSTGGTVLAWERLPSYAVPYAASPIWQSLPLVKQFNYQYTHDQMSEMNVPSGTYNYLCGG